MNDNENTMENYISEDGEYIVPVSWQVYSTVRVTGAKNLAEAVAYVKEHNVPLGIGEYIDASYQVNVETDEEGIMAQNYVHIGDVEVSVE